MIIFYLGRHKKCKQYICFIRNRFIHSLYEKKIKKKIRFYFNKKILKIYLITMIVQKCDFSSKLHKKKEKKNFEIMLKKLNYRL